MIRKHPRYSNLSLKDIPETTREQIAYLVDERGYTITGAFVVAIRDLYQAEYVEAEAAKQQEVTP